MKLKIFLLLSYLFFLVNSSYAFQVIGGGGGLGSDNLGAVTGADVGALFSGTGDYLKSDGTTDSPTYVSFDSDQFNETGDGTVASPKVISIEPTILGSGSITEITGTVYENQPSNPGDLFWNDSGVYLRNNTKLVTLATTTDDLPTGDFTAPTIAPAFSSIGELAMNASETSTIDCTKFTANCTTAGAIAFTGSGPCIADPPVYGGDTCSGADAGGTAEDLAGNLSVAGAVAVDNTANTTIAPEINFVSDDFDRPDSSTLGENWTTINELTAPKIVNGAAVSGGPTALSAAVYNANLSNNQKVCATVNGLNYGVIARSSIETPTYYYASFSAGSVSIKIRRSGTATTLATLGSGFTEFPYTLCLSASGSTETVLTASVDGANQSPFTHTDNPLISGGLGIMGYQQASSIDNFTGEVL